MRQLHFLVAENSDNKGDIFYSSDDSDDKESNLHENNGFDIQYVVQICPFY